MRWPNPRTSSNSTWSFRKAEQGGCGLDFDGGPGNCGAVDPRPDTSSPVVPYDGESFHLLDILKRNERHGA